jgi:hypothetical protein
MEVDVKNKILCWLGTGRVGASSKAMALAAAEMPNDLSHPYDPDDLNRCLLLLEAVPEIRDHMGRVAAMSETWRKIVERWDDVEKCFIEEVGFNWENGHSAPKTYELMKSLGC